MSVQCLRAICSKEADWVLTQKPERPNCIHVSDEQNVRFYCNEHLSDWLERVVKGITCETCGTRYDYVATRLISIERL